MRLKNIHHLWSQLKLVWKFPLYNHGTSSWRGVVAVIKPTYRPGSLEECIRLLPEGSRSLSLDLAKHGGAPHMPS